MQAETDSCLGEVVCGVTKRIQDPMYLCDLAFTDPWNKKALFLWFMLFSLDTLGGILCYIEISNQFISRVVLDQCQFWIWQCCSVFTTQGRGSWVGYSSASNGYKPGMLLNIRWCTFKKAYDLALYHPTSSVAPLEQLLSIIIKVLIFLLLLKLNI